MNHSAKDDSIAVNKVIIILWKNEFQTNATILKKKSHKQVIAVLNTNKNTMINTIRKIVLHWYHKKDQKY